MGELKRAALLYPTVILIGLILVGCTWFGKSTCTTGQMEFANEVLYFGTTKSDGFVTVEQWNTFVEDFITPRFPDGLTHWQASGQWRASDNIVLKEDSYVLNILHPHNKTDEQSIESIINEYKSRFNQESVLRVKSNTCVSF